MKDLLSVLGMGDGEGNTSSTRLILVLSFVSFVASKFYNAHVGGGPITWTGDDIGFLSTILGGGILKTVAEKTPPKQ